MNSDRASVDAFLMGGGEMGRRIRAFDWAASLLGPLPNWSPRLRSALSICLNSNFPIALYWRSDLVLLYNDEWSSIPGTKHPWVLGRPAHEAWPEIWHIIEPLFQHVFSTGEATRSRDQLLPMHRHGFTEECYFDYTFSPIRDEAGRVEGIFNAVLETTTRVISERRLKTLRELSSSQATTYRTIQEACAAVTTIMAANPLDLPFAALYLSDGESRSATLVGQTGLVPGSRSAVEQINLTEPDSVWPLSDVQVDGSARVVTDLRNQLDDFLPTAWPESVREAVVLPMLAANRREPIGFLIVGISPRLALSDEYRGFLDLLASHTTAVITGTQTYIEERRRAEELAELDRAKTVFFSNISHEFRTPLTLMLSPLEELLAAGENHSQEVTESLRLIHRNGVRLSRLVNTLLDFSRIEAGRVQAKFVPLDIAELTSDIVGLFRSAIEWAGIELRTTCTAPREPVYVDPEMWETIVLNLLSNAFKHTLKGFIEVTLMPVDNSVELIVRDSGVGIPEEELPHIFNRFHRVASTTGRTFEGSGIGLSMVLELVRLHGGTVSAASRLDEGSSFTVRIPCGKSHLPADQIAAAQNRQTGNHMLESIVEEIRSWSTSGSSPTPAAAGVLNERESTVESDYFRPAREFDASTDKKPCVLLVEDNADMRRYIHRLLQDEYEVHAASNGADALTALRRQKPELILTDVMMPHMDGFELLKHIRSEPDTQYIPVIMLSARAGEESRVEGMQAGADDYLVKPFSGRELQARVASHLQMAKLRRRTDESIRESEMRFRALTCAGTDVVYQMSADWSRMLFLQGREFISDTQSPSDSWLGKYILPEDQETVLAAIRHAIDHKCMFELEHRVLRSDGTVGWTHSRAVPILDNDGNILEWIGAAGDVTARKEAEVELRESERRERLRADELETMMRAVPACVWIAHDPHCRRITGNHEADRALRLPMHANPSLSAPDDERPTHFRVLKAGRELSPHELPVQLAARGIEVRDFEEEIVFNDGSRIHLFGHAMPLSDERGQVRGSVAAFVDISERKRIEEANAQLIGTLKNADRLKDEFLATLAHELRNPLAPIRTGLQVIKLVPHDHAAVAQAREMMERQLGQLVHLVDDLLDLSRISRGKIELRREAVDLADVIRQAVETCLPLVERAGHELNVTLPDEPIMVDADATRLTQIFSNLLNNAAKYTEPSGQIELSMTRNENEVSVAVTDNGLGIPEEMLPLVFEMFTQVDRNLERSQGGLGIGLSIVKRLVEMHGGRVTAESRGIGKGSTFTVSLPLLQSIETDSNVTSAVATVSKRRILIADDNRDAAYSLALMLRLMGNETRTAEDGVQALEAAAEFRPDLIVLDLGMPRMNGYETARRIRLQSWGKHVFLIALTGWGQEEDRRKSQDAGFDAHIVKPIDPAVLEQLLTRREVEVR